MKSLLRPVHGAGRPLWTSLPSPALGRWVADPSDGWVTCATPSLPSSTSWRVRAPCGTDDGSRYCTSGWYSVSTTGANLRGRRHSNPLPTGGRA
jgi:hypothetical protein